MIHLPSVDKGIHCKNGWRQRLYPQVNLNFAVDEAYLIENGKITKRTKGATLIGDAKEIMQEISSEFEILKLARRLCGSVSGSIYVTVGQQPCFISRSMQLLSVVDTLP
jgi:TldD protein